MNTPYIFLMLPMLTGSIGDSNNDKYDVNISGETVKLPKIEKDKDRDKDKDKDRDKDKDKKDDGDNNGGNGDDPPPSGDTIPDYPPPPAEEETTEEKKPKPPRKPEIPPGYQYSPFPKVFPPPAGGMAG